MLVDWFMLLSGAGALVHGVSLATNLRGYADRWTRWLTGGVNRQPVQHFNATAHRWRSGRAGPVPDVRMLRAIGAILAAAGAGALIQGLGGFSPF